MTGFLRLLDTGLGDARWNVAVTAALLELHAEGRIPDTLRFHRYRRCLLAGASEPAGQAPHGAGPKVVRRVTGGGTVAMTPGILAFDLVVRRGPSRADLGRALGHALARFGVGASFQPPGDVVVAGRKLAGLAGAFDGATRLHQGALLVDCDPAELVGRFCLPVRPVVTLAELAAPAPTMSEVAAAIAAAFSAAIALPLRRQALGRLERTRADDLALEEALEGTAP